MVLSTFISAANEKSEHLQYCILLTRQSNAFKEAIFKIKTGVTSLQNKRQ